MNRKIIKYHIENHGEIEAGIRPFYDDIELTVGSGDAGGEEGEFEEFIRESLSEWFDGATVEILK